MARLLVLLAELDGQLSCSSSMQLWTVAAVNRSELSASSNLPSCSVLLNMLIATLHFICSHEPHSQNWLHPGTAMCKPISVGEPACHLHTIGLIKACWII